MSTPISESTHRSRARRDCASGRIDFDRITRRGAWLSRRHLPPPDFYPPAGATEHQRTLQQLRSKGFVARVPRRLNSLNARAERRQTRAIRPDLRAVNAIIDFVDPGDARIALRCWSCHADIFEIELR
jgi:hypothetical protein